jgi:Tfp pilus assembly protein PilO
MNMPPLPKNISIGMPKRASSSRVPLFEVGLLIVVCGLFYWFIIMPKNSALDQKKADLAQLQDESGKIADSLDKFKALAKNVESHPKEIADLDYALPLDGKITHLQTLIETLAQSVGVTIGDITVAAKGDNDWAGDKALLADPFAATRSVQELSGTVYVLGNLDQLTAFLQKIESSGRIIDVSAVSVDPGPEGSLGLRLTVDGYYLSPY